MKKIAYHIILAVTLLITLASCSNNKELDEMIDALNEECPIPLGAVGQMDKAEYRHNDVTFYYTLVSDFSAELLKDKEGDFHQFMLDNYQYNSDEGFAKLFQTIVDAGAGLWISLNTQEEASFDNEKTNYSHDCYKIYFSNEELRYHLPGKQSTSEDYLQFAVRSLRMQLPIVFGTGMVCNTIDLDLNNMTYIIDCDESNHNISEMQQNLNHDRDLTVEMIVSSTDPSFVKLMDMLKGTHRGLQYKYVGTTSHEEAVMTIKPEELK